MLWTLVLARTIRAGGSRWQRAKRIVTNQAAFKFPSRAIRILVALANSRSGVPVFAAAAMSNGLDSGTNNSMSTTLEQGQRITEPGAESPGRRPSSRVISGKAATGNFEVPSRSSTIRVPPNCGSTARTIWMSNKP